MGMKPRQRTWRWCMRVGVEVRIYGPAMKKKIFDSFVTTLGGPSMKHEVGAVDNSTWKKLFGSLPEEKVLFKFDFHTREVIHGE